MNDVDFIRLVSQHRVFASVRAPSAESALRAAEAALVGGIRLIDVSLVTPGGFRVISDLRHAYGDKACLGAGSVMSFEHVDRAVKSGAQFISMAHTNVPLVELCRRHRVPAMIGAMSPTEVGIAVGVGVPLVTVFPIGSVGGADYMKELTSRMGDVRLCAAGGVGPDNVIDYFNAGAFAVSLGRSLFQNGDLLNENYAAIAERARGIARLAGPA